MSFFNDLKGFGRDVALEAMGAATRLLGPDGGLAKAGPENNQEGQSEQAVVKPPTEAATEDPKSLFWDPYAIVEQLGYKDKPSGMTYGTLNQIGWKLPPVRAIMNNRINQLASFCVPQPDRYKIGFKIKNRDSTRQPSKIESQEHSAFENMFMTTGVTDNPQGRDTFECFMKKVAFDTLLYDQMTFEVVENRKGLPCEWYATDAATFRLADTASTYLDEDLKDEIRYVQVYDGQVVEEFTQGEMCFGVRNPRTDIRVHGYGCSELEMLVPIITSLLWATEYNMKAFSQGSTPKGIINFKGAVPQKALRQFRRHWYSMISGVENSWRTPIMNSEDLQYVNLQQGNRDMEYNAWMDWLIKVCCAMYQMDPIEINFKYGNTGQTSTMNEGGNREKLIESKERGLRPLLRFFTEQFNKFIVQPNRPELEFAFVGLDEITRDEMAKLNQTRVKTSHTVDEIRAEEGLPALPDGKGECILDPAWMQFNQLKEGMAQQAEEGNGGFGNGDEDDEDENSINNKLGQMENGDDDDDEDGNDDDKANGNDKLKTKPKPGFPQKEGSGSGAKPKPKPNFGKSLVFDLDL